MKLINPFLIVIQFLFIILVLRNDAIAGEPSCIALLHPLESKVDEIKGHGGIWGMFEKNYKVRAHARVTLKLDSKIMVLLVRLNHLCSTQNGVPFDEIAQVLVPQLKEKGEQVLIEELVNIGHTLKKAKILIAYAKFAENNLNRKLDFNRISQAVKESQPYVDRWWECLKKLVRWSRTQFWQTQKLLSVISKNSSRPIPTSYWQKKKARRSRTRDI